MKRTIESALIEWKNRISRKPLILRGARQVGKSFIVSKFGQDHFENILIADFEQRRSLHPIFSGDLIVKDLVRALEVEFEQRIIPGKTLIFFDEIQACQRALMSLRYFYEELPSLHILSAGSLLEFSLEESSFPVGRVEFIWLYPLSFSEFLQARNAESALEARPNLLTEKPVIPAIHEKLHQYLKEYFITGGMPEAVKCFVETNSFEETSRIHAALIQSYADDFSKYNSRIDKDCLSRVYEAVPRNLGHQIKYTALCPDKRIDTIKAALNLLERALILHPVRAALGSGLPLGAGASDKRFKLVFVDIGLARTLAGISAKDILKEKDLLHSFRGALAEQYIAQEMMADRNASENRKLYYWVTESVNGSAEIDYLIVNDGSIIPIEVKSGPSGKLKSLHQFLEKHPASPYGLVFHGENIGRATKERIRFFPLYTNFRKIGDCPSLG